MKNSLKEKIIREERKNVGKKSKEEREEEKELETMIGEDKFLNIELGKEQLEEYSIIDYDKWFPEKNNWFRIKRSWHNEMHKIEEIKARFKKADYIGGIYELLYAVLRKSLEYSNFEEAEILLRDKYIQDVLANNENVSVTNGGHWELHNILYNLVWRNQTMGLESQIARKYVDAVREYRGYPANTYREDSLNKEVNER